MVRQDGWAAVRDGLFGMDVCSYGIVHACIQTIEARRLAFACGV